MQELNHSDAELLIYPNPASDYLLVKSPGSGAGCLKIKSLSGELMYQSKISAKGIHQLDLQDGLMESIVRFFRMNWESGGKY